MNKNELNKKLLQVKTDGGRLGPNRSESWLDVQARALHQAARLLQKLIA